MRFEAFAVAVVLTATGCGGSEFTVRGTDASAAPGADQACGDNAHARCEKLQSCSPSSMARTYGDEGTCETRLKLNCLNALSAPDNGNTPAWSEACARAYATWSCTDFLDDAPPQACAQPAGGRAGGQPCGIPGQCATGYCEIAPGAPCGICAPPPQAGDPCGQLTTCGQLLVCWSPALACVAFSLAGGACTRSQPCGAGLSCVGGTCQPAVEIEGAPCDPLGKTGPGCDLNLLLACSSVTRQCAKVVPASAGQPCGTVNGQLEICAGAGTCTPVADGGSDDAGSGFLDAGGGAGAADGATPPASVCVAPAADGARCDLVHGPGCVAPARCVADGGTAGACRFANALECN